MPGTAIKVDDPCQECRGDDSRPRCRQCERLGEKCRRSGGRLRFRPGSSAKYDSTFGSDQTWLSQSRNAKIQFVDQGPELENFYSHDEPDDEADDGRDAASDGLGSSRVPLRRSYTSSTVQASLSPEQKSPNNPNHQFSNLHILPPTSTIQTGGQTRSPLKRPPPDDQFGNTVERRLDRWSKTVYDPIRTSYRVYDSPGAHNSSSLGSPPFITDQTNVPKIVEAEYRRIADSAAATIPEEPLLTPAIWKAKFSWPNAYTTTQCACLMKYYIEKLAPWFDAGDPDRTFAFTVPQRARRCPPLLNAIFTAAARHLTLFPDYRGSDGYITYEAIKLTNLTDDTCVRYHQACIAYLKKLAEDVDHVQDENLLAAAVILRYYEELDYALQGQEPEASFATFNLFFHAQARTSDSELRTPSASSLFAEPSTLNSSSNHHRPHHQARPVARDVALTHLRSFQHACFRVALRQEITTAFMKQRTIHLPLCSTWDLLDTSFSDANAPDFVWADRHLQHCAKVLQFCFGDSSNSSDPSHPLSLSNLTNTPTHQSSVDRWETHRAYHDAWAHSRPLSFSPIHNEFSDEDDAHHPPFPKIWYMSETHVVALQYLDLARILLTVYDPTVPRMGFLASSAQLRVSRQVRDLVVTLCASALSCPASQPARMHAYVAVSVCGNLFNRDDDRTALDKLLLGLEHEFGWPTRRVSAVLKGSWGWD